MLRIATRPELLPFAARLKALRAARGVSQRWLAAESGVSSGAIGYYEVACACPTADVLCRMADVFGVTMDELWRGVGRCDPSLLELSHA